MKPMLITNEFGPARKIRQWWQKVRKSFQRFCHSSRDNFFNNIGMGRPGVGSLAKAERIPRHPPQ